MRHYGEFDHAEEITATFEKHGTVRRLELERHVVSQSRTWILLLSKCQDRPTSGPPSKPFWRLHRWRRVAQRWRSSSALNLTEKQAASVLAVLQKAAADGS